MASENGAVIDGDTGPRTRWSRGALTAVSACPMCGSAERRPLVSTTDAMRPAPDDWRLWECARCDSAWLDPRPSDDSLGAAYDFDYLTHDASSAPVRSSRLTSLINGYLNARYRMHRAPASRWGRLLFAVVPPLRLKLDYFGRHLPASPGGRRLLDIGCGNGDFVRVARDMGWAAEGVDPDPAAVARCREQGLAVTEGFISDLPREKRDGYWGAITMSHSLEHVPDPVALLRQAFDMLEPGGMLWIAVPNPRSLGARFYGAAWESYDAPRHLVLPAIDALVSAGARAGFDAVHLERRGAHSGRLFRRSADIARERHATGWRVQRWTAGALSLVADVLATVSARRTEEIVFVARKPAGRRAEPSI